MLEWNIQSRGKVCRGCGKAFAHDQPYHTLLFDERDHYVRLDVCESCWAEQYGQGATARKGFVSHWQGTYEIPVAEPEPIRKETAETLLRKLSERNDPQYVAAVFILAVMLERKRTLKVKDQVYRDGQRVFVYEHPKTGELFTIPDPALRLDQLEAVQREVAALIERGLPDPVAPAPDGTAGAADAEGDRAPAADAAMPQQD